MKVFPKFLLGSFVCVALCACVAGEEVTWNFDSLSEIGGHAATVAGDPKIISTELGKAIEFDGVDDGVFLDVHPLEGYSTFTVEVIFRPYSDGASEQRFFHMQEAASESRVMFETRLVDNEFWFLDTFIKSGEQSVTHYASDKLHPIGPWYHVAIVVDELTFSHFVDGQLELTAELEYKAQRAGLTSLGVRLNEVHWFRGAIKKVRITPRALQPREFLPDERN